MLFNNKQQNTLISIAEWSIQDFIQSGRRHPLPGIFEIEQPLTAQLGVFVSVYVGKDLRGCIGTFSESTPLYENVRQMSVQAATEDRRFDPVTLSELNDMEVEISVLTPRVKINGPQDIIIGRHGIYLIHGIRRATLLPQVAVKYGWTPVEFLECCARNKLGMHKDSWKEAELYVYEAEIIR